jgi:cyclopropane fatty-acyl-phospholipid synthase-like methyltransferase
MFTSDDISKYYDLSEIHYRRVWQLDKSRSLHYGYWDDSTKTLHEALLKINEVMSAAAAITKSDRVLDAGCGIGGSSIWLSKNIGCNVVGISLNQRQVDKANDFATREGLVEQVVFEKTDYHQTNYPDASFDVVWGIESICYADKSKFFKEANRLLKPGGRIVVADFFRKPGLNKSNLKLISDWESGWAVNRFATREEFENGLKLTGFNKIKTIDITQNILPSAKKLYRSWFAGAVGANVYRLFNPKASTLGRNNVANARLQYKTLKAGLWEYLLVNAVKSL